MKQLKQDIQRSILKTAGDAKVERFIIDAINRDVQKVIKENEKEDQVEVPQLVAKWIEMILRENVDMNKHEFTAHLFQLFENKQFPSVLVEYISKDTSVLVRLGMGCYKVKKQTMWEVPIPGLTTTDGAQQYLTFKNERYFASRKHMALKQTFTTEELLYVPDLYRAYAIQTKE